MQALETVEQYLALQERHLGPEGYHLEIVDHLSTRPDWPEEALGPRLISLGSQMLPAASQMWIWPEGSKSALGWITIRLGTDRKVQFPQINSARHNVDAHTFFRDLLGVRDLEWWKTRALLELVATAALPYVEPDGQQRNDVNDLPEDALRALLEDMQKGVEEPQRTRRDRLTPDRLRDVAAVYRAAWRTGGNPTEAVAAYFKRPYSTASRWVVSARKAGVLGPSDSSRGGEVEVAGE